MNDMVVYKENQLSAAEIRANVNLVQSVMQAVMKDGTHYGVIPGTPKPSLWKPGAEVLAATFRIAVSYKTEDLSTPDAVRYRVTAIGIHQSTGITMGEGMGECSSNEGKYKWRKAGSKKEFDNTPEDRRRIQYGYDKQRRQEYEVQQVRTDPADLANTILKMACKRAQVAMTLNVTAASDIFTQDIEDLPEELREDVDTRSPKELPPIPANVFERYTTDKLHPETGEVEKFSAKSLIQRGEETAENFIAFLSAKYTLTEEIKSEINGWMPKEQA